MSAPPWIALLVAALVSIIAALFSFPYRYVKCWVGWAGRWGIIWILGYFVLAGGAGGMIGWLLGWLTKFQPTPVEALNGIFYGAAGALAIGGQVKGSPSKGSGDLRDVKSLLIRLLERIEDGLDELTADKAAKWLRARKSNEVIIAAWQIEGRIRNEEMTAGAKRTILENLVTLMETVGNGSLGEPERKRAQEQLMDFCVRYYVREHLGKPILKVPVDST